MTDLGLKNNPEAQFTVVQGWILESFEFCPIARRAIRTNVNTISLFLHSIPAFVTKKLLFFPMSQIIFYKQPKSI